MRTIQFTRVAIAVAFAASACGDGALAPTSTRPLASSSPPPAARDAAVETGSSTAVSLRVRCTTAVVVGLEWTSIPDAAAYRIERGGAVLASTSTGAFSDLTVGAGQSYVYTVRALSAAGASLSTATATVKTPEASPNGDAPYCPSKRIRSATWNWSTGYNQQNGSDLWPSTWGADGTTYLFFGDGGGFFGSDTEGRASFGVARLTGKSPVVSASDAENVYGGLDALHPGAIHGKAGSILAVGDDFYALGGIYRNGESGGPSGSPNHDEVVYSKGNAYSWQDSPWSFCSSDASGTVTQGSYCASSFVHFGPGDAGAFDEYVYMTAVPVQGWFGGAPQAGPANTYMMRAPRGALTEEAAYAYFAGLDPSGEAKWSADATEAAPIFSDRNAKPMGIGNIVYSAALGRFIGPAQGQFVSQAALYESEHPWGPWSTVAYLNTNPDGTGGFGGLGSTAYALGHGDTLGLNFISAWTSEDGATMWVVFSSDGQAPDTALLPALAGRDMDSFSLVSVTFSL